MKTAAKSGYATMAHDFWGFIVPCCATIIIFTPYKSVFLADINDFWKVYG